MRMHVAGLLMAGLLGLAMPVAAEFARFELAGPPQPAFAKLSATPGGTSG